MSSKRYSSLLLTVLFVSSTAAANAGSKSMLDPYVSVQPPLSKKPKVAGARGAHQDVVESTHTTYISMPMPAEEKPSGGGGGGKFGGLFSKKDKQAKQPKQERVAEAPAAKGDGLASKSLDSMKNAGSSIVGGTKAAGSKIAEGSKVVGGGIATGAKKVGGGIATGAKASGDYFMKGVHAIGHGFKSTGEKVKGGAGSAGSKVAGLPKLWGKKTDGQEKAKQEAIAKAIAERNAAKQQPQQQQEIAKDAEWEGTDSVANAESAKPAPSAAPVKSNTIGFQTPQHAVKAQGKGGGITGGFTKALGKLNPFGGKSPAVIQPVVRPQSAIQSTAATQDAIPQ
ncbi:MAG: hypothetical protein K2Y39_01840 [Candidatus Obscuribacterales bacterium]|nr:hypothetical protein [Candidatus Obscuribacterales bacterium]